MLCRLAKNLDYLSHLNNTARPCLNHTFHAVLRTCRRVSDFSRPRHAVWVNNCRLLTDCGPRDQLRVLPATTRSYTKAVFKTLISHKLNCSWVLSREIPIPIDLEKDCFGARTRCWFHIFKILSVLPLTLMTSSLAFPPVRWNVTVMEHLCFQSRCLPHWDHFLGYCATLKHPRLFCLRLQDSVEFGHKITYIFEWECRKHSQQLGVPLTVCSCKFSCLHRSWLKLSGKVGTSTSLGEMLRHPLLQSKGRGSLLVGVGLELGILSASASRYFPKTDLLKVHQHLICRIHQHQLW